MTSKGSWNQSHSLEATVSKCDGVAAEHVLSNYLHCVFPEPEQTKIASSRKTLNFENLPQHISQLLSTGLESSQSQRDGRLGPSRVVMDRSNGFEGLLIVDEDLLGVIGHSNFSSIRSSTCVYKGCWMYEVMLSSQGLMQIGWCTLECRFNQEEGVGDTPNSYAYDGSRVRKWNVTTTNYGKPWAAGDIVTCLLDLDEGTCSFFLNGVALGTAFSDVRLGPKMAYFPAVSLSFRENVVFNFGGRPLRYPVEGYQPLQDPPFADLLQAQKLMGYLKSAMTMTVNPHEVRSVPVRGDVNVFLAISHIFAHLTPLLVHSYLVDAVLLRFLLTANAEPESSVLIPYFLDLAWVLMEDFEVENSLKQLMMSLLRAFRFSPLSPDMAEQVCHLQLLLVILQHDKSRRFLLNSVLFDAMRFPAFFNVKLPVRVDEAGLEQMIPVTWWGKQTRGDEHESPEHCGRRQAYEHSCHHLTKHIQVLEDLQVAVLKLLLNNTDGGQEESTRDVFLRKFRKFLEENISSASPTVLCPPEYLLCFLHRLTRTLREIWVDGATAIPEHMPLEDAYVPPQVFYNDGLSYFELQRLGGLTKHLRKIHKDDLQCLGIETVPDRDLATMDDLVDDVDRPVQAARSSQPMRHTWSPHLMGLMVGVRAQGGITVIEPRAIGMNLGPRRSTSPASASQPLISPPRTSSQKETQICTDWQSLLRGSPTLESICPHVDGSLLALLDGLLLLYHIGAHQQLGKMVGVAEDVKEYALALTETEAKISRCPLEQCDVMKELQRSENVFRDKLNQLSRRLAWHNAAIYSSEKMGDIYWLLRVALGSVEHADRSGPFFAFLPEFYVSVSVNAYNALKSYFTGAETLPGFEGTLIRLATVLARHFVDPRIVGTDIKDLLMQALASFVCFPSSLHALEEVPDSIRMSMLRSLLAPYEQRPWAQTNWILVRLWKGSGFGYRYTHLIPPLRLKPSDANNPTLQKPCPSLRLQQQAATLLQQRPKQATAFLNSLINQLNWAFSEFVGMIQEIQQTAERPERNIVDSRQLKVCATCFDLSVSLLRVLEMTAHLVPSTLSDPTSPASDLLLARLSQLLNQILHRITAEGGLFDRMVSFRLPVLEQVDHYPILAAVTGTLIQLIVLGTPECRERATAALLADPGFQLRCVCCLLGEGDGARKDPTNVGASTRFSFRKHPSYVNAEELQMVEQLVSHLSVESTHAAASTVPTSEEDLCPICCAHCISAVFQPCGHKSCKTCIQQHLMNNKECFFCKTVISAVNDFTVPPSS